MTFIKSACFLILYCEIVTAVVVIPKPILDIADATSYSITLNWTLPKNELYDGFVVEMSPEEGDVLDFELKDMKREYINLTPGTVYTFVVQTFRQDRYSDKAVIVQDTIPLAPTKLELRSFNSLVLTLEGPYFGDAEFTVDTHGVEATWREPTSGIAECYIAEIHDDDGLQAIPGENDEILKDELLRQFINLTPGKTYKVTIFAATCGEGHLGELRSDPISAEIRLPPAEPPTVVLKEVTISTAELYWGDDPVPGFYDDFEVVQVGDTTTSVVVDTPISRTDLGRNISNLLPCTKYELDVFTILEGQRSENGQRVVVETMPDNPTSLEIVDYGEKTVTLEWTSLTNKDVTGYVIEVSPRTLRPIRTEGSLIKLDGLTPGVQYTITVKSECRQTETTLSTGSIITQTTKPFSPVLTTSECKYIGRAEDTIRLYDSVPWESADPSLINLIWAKPTEGVYDGFVVDYSPYDFEQGLSSPAAPMIYSADKISTEISIPVSGRVITASIRTISNNILSEPTIQQVYCGGPDGDSSLRCRSFLLYWTIKITPIEDFTQLLVELPGYPIHNATVFMDDLDEVLVFENNTFTIRNPCNEGPQSKITVYPRCPPLLPYCPVITRRICTHRRGHVEEAVIPNACCNSRLYNTNEEVCCHNKLLKKFDRTSEECCVSKWYNKNSQKCCNVNPLTGSYNVKNGVC